MKFAGICRISARSVESVNGGQRCPTEERGGTCGYFSWLCVWTAQVMVRMVMTRIVKSEVLTLRGRSFAMGSCGAPFQLHGTCVLLCGIGAECPEEKTCSCSPYAKDDV